MKKALIILGCIACVAALVYLIYSTNRIDRKSVRLKASLDKNMEETKSFIEIVYDKLNVQEQDQEEPVEMEMKVDPEKEVLEPEVTEVNG